MIERWLEKILFSSRWLLAPIYLGLVVGLVALVVKDIQHIIHIVPNILNASESDLVLDILGLIDLSLTASLVIIVIFSFLSRAKLGVGVKWEFTVQPYIELFYSESLSGERSFDPTYLQIFFNSVLYSLVTAIVCLVLSIPIALWIATRSPKWRTLLVFLVTIPFWTSLLIRTYAFVIILNDNGPINGALTGLGILGEPIPMLYTPFATIVGLVYSFLPFMILPIYSVVKLIDPRLSEAGATLGATPLYRFTHVTLPLTLPGIVSGVAFVFSMSVSMFVIPSLLIGDRFQTLATLTGRSFLLMRNEQLGSTTAVILLVLAVSIVVGSTWLARRIGGSQS